jgi:large subunit ribosomal protein L22
MSKEARASLKALRGSPQKVGLVVAGIRGLSASKALVYLKGVQKRSAFPLSCLLESAIANAENNHGLEKEKLFIDRVEVGKSLSLKRLDIRGRSRMGRICKVWSNVCIVLRERD